MKRMISVLLTVAIVCSLAVTAFANTTDTALNNRLAAVTLQVKQQLGLDDRYTDFYGDLSDDGINPYWSLTWSSDTENLRVNATEEGKILYYSHTNTQEITPYRNDGGYAPIFPSVSRADAQKVAEAFVEQLLGANETVDFSANTERLDPYETSSYYFSSTLYLNGLPSPISVSVNVRTSDKQVRSFSRSDRYNSYVGEITDATPTIAAEDARDLFRPLTKMNLQYVIESYDDSLETYHAVLRYLPTSTYNNHLVDAKTGELIDLAQAQRDAETSDSVMEESKAESNMTANGMITLSPTELEGIAKLDGAMAKEDLDQKVRTITEFKLQDFDLSSVDYSLNNETGDITASMTYTYQVKNAIDLGVTVPLFEKMLEGRTSIGYIRKYVTVDGKTGELKSLRTSYPYVDYRNTTPETVKIGAQAGAAFLEKFESERFAETALYKENKIETSYNVPRTVYTYAQSRHNYFLPDNTLTVGVNLVSGAIDQYSVNWFEKEIVFDSPDEIISNEKACELYENAFEVPLEYRAVPIAVDPNVPEYKLYATYGYSYVYALRLAYIMKTNGSISGIDAKTGEVLRNTYTASQDTVTYTDLANNPNKDKLQELAQYGIGFGGSEFKATAQVTELDMLRLLISAQYAYYADPANESLAEYEINNFYAQAYSLGILEQGQKDPTRIVTRAEFAKVIVKISAYGKIGPLHSIFVCRFADEKNVNRDDYGYLAIAQGLGILSVAEKEAFEPYHAITREDAALMLYAFMDRDI